MERVGWKEGGWMSRRETEIYEDERMEKEGEGTRGPIIVPEN